MAETLKIFRYECSNLQALPETVSSLLRDAGDRRVFAFHGEMGAGKTTFIKELCHQLHVTDPTASPTFTIVNEYLTTNGEPVYHFDFYRIKNETEAFDLGFENYLYSGNYCFIEWPEKISSLLPPEIARVTIEANEDKRIITLSL